MKRVPLRLEGGKVVGHADVDESTGKVLAHVTDPVASAQLAAALNDQVGAFSIGPAWRAPKGDKPPMEEAMRNQLHGTCGGTGWRFVGGEALGWWETCKGCEACA